MTDRAPRVTAQEVIKALERGGLRPMPDQRCGHKIKLSKSPTNHGATTSKGLKTHYGQGSSESPEALINRNGHLEVSLKEGRAADQLGVKVGDPIQVS